MVGCKAWQCQVPVHAHRAQGPGSTAHSHSSGDAIPPTTGSRLSTPLSTSTPPTPTAMPTP